MSSYLTRKVQYNDIDPDHIEKKEDIENKSEQKEDIENKSTLSIELPPIPPAPTSITTLVPTLVPTPVPTPTNSDSD